MQAYKDLSGVSGVVAYEIGDDHIDVEFKGRVTYRYDSLQPGRSDIEKMKALALSGDDLATYINQHVRKRYAKRLK